MEVRQVILIIESPSYFQGRFGVCEKCGVEDTNMGMQEAPPLFRNWVRDF